MDSQDEDLEEVSRNMINDIQSELSRMQNALGASVEKHYVTKDKFNSKGCYGVIDKMRIRPLQDVVLLVVLAHGNQSNGGGQYPNIKFEGEDRRAFGEIMDLILVKRPAYLLSIVNSCNHISGRNNEGEGIYEAFNNCDKQVGQPNRAAYQALFQSRDYPMAVTFLSAQKGTATLVDEYGGIPFQAMMRALQHCTSDAWAGGELPDWSDVMLTAQTLNICDTDDRQECPYAELARIEISGDYINRSGKGIFFCE